MTTDRTLLQQALEALTARRSTESEWRELITALRARLAEPDDTDAHQKAAAWCDEHQPNGGARSYCLVCACRDLSFALSQIDYLCGEPNEMGVSGYDVHRDEKAVVEHVRARLAEPPAVTLPPLPPELWRSSRDEPADCPMYTADQMRDYAIAALRAAGVEVTP